MKSIKYALRVVLKNKFYSLLNIFGLAIGLAVAMVILLYVQQVSGSSWPESLNTAGPTDTFVYIIIGIFILLLACINYVNLATARATQRSKEVGVRKVLGSTRQKLQKQFMSEAMVTAFLSLFLAVLVVNILLQNTSLNALLGTELKLEFSDNPVLLFGSLGITATIGLLAGLYPAFYLSAISVPRAMSGSASIRSHGLFLRKVLVTFQFFVSTAVVIATLLMSDQVALIQGQAAASSSSQAINFQEQSMLMGILSYICLLISCLGLIGLSSFTTATRIKEIGLRKVLGATVSQLVFMIFKDIMVLVSIGFVVATPVAYLAIQDWLQLFERQVPLQTFIIAAAAIAGIISLAVAFFTVSFHSLKATRQNPVKALRYE